MITIWNTNVYVKISHDNNVFVWFISFAEWVGQLIKKVD